MAYATAADVTSFLGVTLSSPEQTVITELIAAGQALIDNRTNRTFEGEDLSVPADLKHALVRWVSEVFKSREEGGKSISRLSLGPYSVDYLTQDGIPKFVEDTIKRYRLIPGV